VTTYAVRHVTRYRYAAPVNASYGQHHLLPRDTPWQQVHDARVAVSPTPDEQDEHGDLLGNRVGWFALQHAHTELEVAASSRISVREPELPDDDPPWEDVRDHLRDATDPLAIEARGLAIDSPLVAASPALRALGQEAFTPGRGVVAALRDLASHLHAEFEFDPTATTVASPVDEVLARRAGVCQDFAHVMVGALRSLRLPARYVSGYLETEPPPGMQRLQGADASHAWAALHVPGHGWVDADPTNDQLVGDRHVTVGWGRDYADVTPVKGVIQTHGHTESLVVEVDVERLA